MSNAKNQHYIPQFYLREWVDSNTPQGHEPYVWVFDRKTRKGRKKAPHNIFSETDLYTINLKSGGKVYAIEEALSNLEGKYATIFREKIKNHLPLNEEENIFLCAFVGAMLQRTIRHKDTLEKFYDDIIERTESLERQNNLQPKESLKLKKQKENVHKLGLVKSLPDLTELLMKMSVAFLCAENTASEFVTSDDPCNLFNPDLQFQHFYSPGLGQKNIQLTLPLSPKIMLCMSWVNFKGYISYDKKKVEEANRMIVGHCYEYFVFNKPSIKKSWSRKYPLDFFFLVRVFRKDTEMLFQKLKYKFKYARKRRL